MMLAFQGSGLRHLAALIHGWSHDDPLFFPYPGF